MNRTLDYVPRLVEANRAYRVTADDYGTGLSMKARYWTPGYPVLDQGQEGACVGFGCTGEAMASPVRNKFRLRYTATLVVDESEAIARAVYHRALQIDEFEGERDEGTSVRAGMLVGRERGWWQGFRWAFNMLELRAALEEGPVVIGVEWRESMYWTDEHGMVEIGGPVAGGHCLLISGYSPNYGYPRQPVYRWRNSWGLSYGRRGSGYIAADDLDRVLFQSGGEAAVPVNRQL